MSNQEFLTYDRFNDLAAAMQLVDLLKENNIEVFIEDNSSAFDPSFANNETNKEYCVKLAQGSFATADLLRDQISDRLIAEVEPDYYLFDFSDEELLDLVAKRDEWSHFDFKLALKILKDRGIEQKPEQLAEMKQERLEELAMPAKHQTLWVTVGYFSAFFGGFLGLFIGWHLYTFKKTLPNGEIVYAYIDTDRDNGKWILIIAGIVSAIDLVLMFMYWS